MHSIPETRKETRKDFQVLIPTSEVIASFFYYLILTTILWGVADQFPQPQYLFRRPVRTDGQTDEQTEELIRVGLGNLRFLQVNTLPARGPEEPRNSQELLIESVDLTKFVGPLRV